MTFKFSSGLNQVVKTALFIFIISFFLVPQKAESNNDIASQNTNISNDSLSPFSLIRQLKSDVDNNRIAIFSYAPNHNELKTYLFFSFIFLFFILLIIKFSSPEYLSELFSSLFNKNYLIARVSKAKFNISINSIFLDIIFVVIVSYFFFQLLFLKYELNYLLILSGMIGFTIVQFLIVSIAYSLFFGSGNANIHLAHVLTSNRITGIIFVPLLFLITYIDPTFKNSALIILAVFLLLLILFRAYRILNQLKIIYKLSFLFIFLYICTFELSLYFVCFKIISLFINS